MDPMVRSDRAPLLVDDCPRARPIAGTLIDERVVASGRNEAELLALPFAGTRKTERDGARPDVRFARVPERKFDPTELGLRKRMEKIALIFARISRAMELHALAVFPGARVVPGRHLAGPQPIGERKELGHFDAAIAGHAGARRRASEVSVDEGLDHFAREELAPVERVMRNAEMIGDAP